MAMIQVNHLTFGYEGSLENILEDVSFYLDTDWKLGLIGRNGKGKTTFLKLLQGQYHYYGNIIKNVTCDYFPFEVTDKNRMTLEIVQEIAPNAEEWEVRKELNLLRTDGEVLYRNFSTLSGGEQVKILLVSLFLKENHFLLIDEPTNHLDKETRDSLALYFKKKKGFILVSHDRVFLDHVVDHIIAMNRTNIEIQKGNFSSWQENKKRQDDFEKLQNEKIEKDIGRLRQASKDVENWSNQIEKSKYGTSNSGSSIDRGYIGHQSARMMKKAKVMEKRMERAIDEKKELLHNVEKMEMLTIKPLESKKNPIAFADYLQIQYEDKNIFQPVSFTIRNRERIAIQGKNGAGKTSLLKLFLKENLQKVGDFYFANDLKISYVSQSTENLKGTLKDIAKEFKIEEGIFKAMLSKMGFSKLDFDKEISAMSEGQKKKVLLAKSITESAHLYIWDEPLNYIDVLTSAQIEDAILKYQPTLIFVEHDEMFTNKIATKKICLESI